MANQFANLSRDELIAQLVAERARADQAEAALQATVASAVRTLRNRWVNNHSDATTKDMAAIIGAVVSQLVEAQELMHRLRGPMQVAYQHNGQVCAAGRARGDQLADGPPARLGRCRVGGCAYDCSVLRDGCGAAAGGCRACSRTGDVSYLQPEVQDLLIEFHFLVGLIACSCGATA
jgi:hypothetical protein